MILRPILLVDGDDGTDSIMIERGLMPSSLILSDKVSRVFASASVSSPFFAM